MTKGTVQANPFGRQWADAGKAVLEAVQGVGEGGWYVLGQEVTAFEEALGRLQRRAHAVGCASGLDAIEIGLRSLGLRRGDRVLTTPFSAFATTLAILRAGGVPVFVDVDRSGLLDLEKAEQCLEAHREIRYLLPAHLFGHALDLEALEALKRRFDLRVVEDCAQAIGAHSHGRPVGAVAEVAAFSFYPTKNLGALGDGGALTADDEALAASARRLRDYGQSQKYVHTEIGLNSRLDELHAAVLRRVFLPRLDAWTRRRVAIAEHYRSDLRHAEVEILPVPRGSSSVWHLFPVRVPAGKRDAFLAHLDAAGIQAGVHYPALIPDQPALKALPEVAVYGDLEVARQLAAEEVSLPIHPYLEDGEIDRVIQVIHGWKR